MTIRQNTAIFQQILQKIKKNLTNFTKEFHFISSVTDSLGNHVSLSKNIKTSFPTLLQGTTCDGSGRLQRGHLQEATFLTDMKVSNSKVNI